MIIVGYRLNLAALLARVIYRWHWRLALGALVFVVAAGLVTGRIPPIWRGAAALTVQAARGAHVAVDGRAWPFPIYAGDHRVVARLPDGRVSSADVTLVAGQALTLTMPTGIPAPRVCALAPAAPGTRVERVWWADGAWRVVSAPVPAADTPDDDAEPTEATVTPAAGQTVALTERGAERLATIDAYAGLADQAHAGEALIEAVYVPNQRADLGDRSAGVVEVRGWGAQTATITVTAPLTLVRFSPAGDALLLAEQAAAGEQVTLVRKTGERLSVVAVPGQLTRLTWRDDGGAVVLHSRAQDRLTLTLARLQPTVVAAVVADLDATRHAGDIAPLTWGDDALLWVAPDEGGDTALWRAPVASLVPERVTDLAARALAWLPDVDLRVLLVQGERLVVGRMRGGQLYTETVVPQVSTADDLAGMWHGDELLVQSGDRAWLIDFRESNERGGQ